jgi:alanine-alpha-ketoisovalerate/valine-pyruvate aminotransferase
MELCQFINEIEGLKTGYRQIGSTKKVIDRKLLTDIEIRTHRAEGKLLLWFWLGVFVVGFIIWLITDIVRLSKYE